MSAMSQQEVESADDFAALMVDLLSPLDATDKANISALMDAVASVTRVGMPVTGLTARLGAVFGSCWAFKVAKRRKEHLRIPANREKLKVCLELAKRSIVLIEEAIAEDVE